LLRKERYRPFQLEFPKGRSISLGCLSELQSAYILSTKQIYMDRVIRKAIDTELRLNNMNREDGFCLRKSWEPLICPVKIARSLSPRVP
jgi:hypothetical protein